MKEKRTFKTGDRVAFYWYANDIDEQMTLQYGTIRGFGTSCSGEDAFVVEVDCAEYRICFKEDELFNGDIIGEFAGEYEFLSNFYEPAYVIIDGHFFTNSEAAFHSYKCPERIGEFTILDPKNAKRLGRSVKLRPDWDKIKDDVMYNVYLLKFTQNIDLTKKLLATEFCILIEGNTWGDTYLACMMVKEKTISVRFSWKFAKISEIITMIFVIFRIPLPNKSIRRMIT